MQPAVSPVQGRRRCRDNSAGNVGDGRRPEPSGAGMYQQMIGQPMGPNEELGALAMLAQLRNRGR